MSFGPGWPEMQLAWMCYLVKQCLVYPCYPMSVRVFLWGSRSWHSRTLIIWVIPRIAAPQTRMLKWKTLKDWVISVWAMAESLNPIKPFKDVKKKASGICGVLAMCPTLRLWHLSSLNSSPGPYISEAPGAGGTLPLDHASFFSSLQDARIECHWSNNLINTVRYSHSWGWIDLVLDGGPAPDL